jgi:DNA polymerase III epsilon subunit-like protein
MNDHLLRFDYKKTYLCIDYETESLNLAESKPWQFAAVKFRLKEYAKTGESRINVLEEHDIYIGWDYINISKDAATITRFDRAKWARLAVDPKKAFEKTAKLYDEADYIVGHNLLGYDINIDRNSRLRLGLPVLPIHKKILDTLPLGRGIEGRLNIPYTPDKNLLHYQLKMYHYCPPEAKKRGFATLGGFCKLFNIDYDPQMAHDALYDVTRNAEVFAALLHKIEI